MSTGRLCWRESPRTDGDRPGRELALLHDGIVGRAVDNEVLQALRHQRRLCVLQLAPLHALQPEAVLHLRHRQGPAVRVQHLGEGCEGSAQ